MTKLKALLFAAPLALTLAACGGGTDGETGEVAKSEPVAAVEAPDGTQWLDQVQRTEADGYVLGNPDAPIKVIEYASLTCPGCAAFVTGGLEELKSEYVNSGRVSYELRNQIHGPHDLALATLVRCGGNEAAYHARSEQVWRNLPTVLGGLQQNGEAVQQAITLPPEQRLVRIAEVLNFYPFFAQLGLPEEQARQCLADEATYNAIAERSNTQSEELNITQTPTFLINGTKVDMGAARTAWEGLEPQLQRAGAR
ncbi:thioredoxin domain-containing protein [Qipengyuania sp. JC766]|uniref:thioredoxin domain-containing protein n=1 Tax=Qipengyuania sp. JC766 TaxID=3232139 RepID=UPI0034584437